MFAAAALTTTTPAVTAAKPASPQRILAADEEISAASSACAAVNSNCDAACSAQRCKLVKGMEPTLPMSPTFMAGQLNPCLASTAGTMGLPLSLPASNGAHCLPYVHIVSGWHMFSDEALGWLKKVKALEQRGGMGCFDDWGDDDAGGKRWMESWGKQPADGSAVILAHCNKLLTWYPAFAGRYTSAWGKAYGPCKEREVAKGGDYYGTKMWQVCRPAAITAHDAAMGSGGAGREATPPFVMRAVYGARVRIISAMRNPVDRLETSFWGHRHYPLHYGADPAGLGKYIAEQTAAFVDCQATHGTRRCAYLFELLGPKYSDVFFHCDQLLRGLYEPFVRDWHLAFGAESFLAISVETLLDNPRDARYRILEFLGLPAAPASSVDTVAGTVPPSSAREAAGSYKALHCASLRAAKAAPMSQDARALIEAFYRPYNHALADVLGWKQKDTWPKSTECTAAQIANASAAAPVGHRSRALSDSLQPPCNLTLSTTPEGPALACEGEEEESTRTSVEGVEGVEKV